MIHENISSSEDYRPNEDPRCDVDSIIVGGPYEHSGPRFMHHMVYTDNPNLCYDNRVCLAHVPWSFMFLGNEMNNHYAEVATAYLEPIPSESTT